MNLMIKPVSGHCNLDCRYCFYKAGHTQGRAMTAADAERLLQAALASGETVVTGGMMPEWLLARADYISRIEALRHPYETEGLPARKGAAW